MAWTQFSTTITRKLGRSVTSGPLLAEIDGLRFVAIASVILFHLSTFLIAKSAPRLPAAEANWAAVIVSTGHCGVLLFFMISGFILARPWLAAGRPVHLGRYFLRRLTRLEPPYLLSLVGITLTVYLLKHPPAKEFFTHFLASFFYQHSNVYGTANASDCVTWSLETEVQFYTLLPLLGFAIFDAKPWVRRTVLLALILIGCTVLHFFEASPRIGLSLIGALQYFSTGVLIADLHQTWRPGVGSTGWDFLGLLGFIGVPVAEIMAREIAVPAVLPCFFLIFVSALRGRLIRKLLSHPVIATVGGMCYSIYLIHYQLISMIGRITLPIGQGLPYPAYLVVQTVLVCALMAPPVIAFFVYIERPCMDRNWPSRLRVWATALVKGRSAADTKSLAD
jgi:peptidoglycan/LPS O-acetylase OafA/YrhL